MIFPKKYTNIYKKKRALIPRGLISFMVGRTRFELVTSSASRKHSPTELTALVVALIIILSQPKINSWNSFLFSTFY